MQGGDIQLMRNWDSEPPCHSPSAEMRPRRTGSEGATCSWADRGSGTDLNRFHHSLSTVLARLQAWQATDFPLVCFPSNQRKWRFEAAELKCPE